VMLTSSARLRERAMNAPQAEILDPRLVFLERAAARLQLVNSADMSLDEAMEGLLEAFNKLQQEERAA
jgi:hypothetical protein